MSNPVTDINKEGEEVKQPEESQQTTPPILKPLTPQLQKIGDNNKVEEKNMDNASGDNKTIDTTKKIEPAQTPPSNTATNVLIPTPQPQVVQAQVTQPQAQPTQIQPQPQVITGTQKQPVPTQQPQQQSVITPPVNQPGQIVINAGNTPNTVVPTQNVAIPS
jgi:hypothetical protein